MFHETKVEGNLHSSRAEHSPIRAGASSDNFGGDVSNDGSPWCVVRRSGDAERDEISSKDCVRPSRQEVELVSCAGTEFKHTILRLVTLIDSLPSSVPGGKPYT